MPDIFDYPVLPEMPCLIKLAEELECTLHVIAHAGRSRNRRYIRDRQKYFRERFGRFIEHFDSDVAVFHIISAYETLQQLLDGNPRHEEIRQACEECLDEHLTGGEPSEEYAGVFQEFYEEA